MDGLLASAALGASAAPEAAAPEASPAPEAAPRRAGVPGLTAEWPISPSGLETFLGCPHRFLLAKILGFEEPAAPPARREIGQPAYGGLFHLVAETFYRDHGAAFARRERTLAEWQEIAESVVEKVFAGFLEQYPLVGEAIRGQQRERLRHDFQEFIEHDWTTGAGRRFVAVERDFGRPAPVTLVVGAHTPAVGGHTLDADAHALHLRGQIDRLDVEAGRTLVRDLKTGRAHPRQGAEAGPDPVLDVQLAVYALVARALARQWGLPPRVAAAYTYVNRGVSERAWRGEDFGARLEPAAREWLALAANLLAGRAFPRTPDPEDCAHCPFLPVCGPGAHERAAQMLGAAEGVLGRFARLKGLGAEA
jgi:RecB family exonuclease